MTRVAVLGLGRIGTLHARNLAQSIPGCELSWAIDAVPDRARRLAEELDVPWATEAQRALEDPATAGVVIATPTPTHASLIELAAQCGKHVLCEKPIALELESTWRAVDAVRKAGVELQIGFQRRFDRDLQVVREAVHAGRLGEIRSFRSTHRNARLPEAADRGALGGLFADVAIHDFDLARWLVGEIDHVSAIASDIDGAPTFDDGDAVHAVTVLRFAGGALGTIETSRAGGYGFDASLEIVGTEATIRVGTDHRVYDVEWLTAGRAVRPLVQSHAERHAAAYVCELEQFARIIENGGPPVVGGADGAAAFVIAAAAAKALRERRPIELRRAATSGEVAYTAVG